MSSSIISNHAFKISAYSVLIASLAACTAEPSPDSSSSLAQSSSVQAVSSSVMSSSSVQSSANMPPSSSSQAAVSSSATCDDTPPSYSAGETAYKDGSCVTCHGQPANNGMTTGGAQGRIDARKTSFDGLPMDAFILSNMRPYLSTSCKTNDATAQKCAEDIAHYLKVATGAGTDSGAACEASSSVSSVSSVAPVSSSSASSSVDAIGNLPLVVAIDVGSTSGTTVDGVQFQADKYSRGGMTNSTTDAISGTASGALYQSERYGAFSYDVPVTAAGRYTVELHFAEIYLNAAGERSFSVQVENTTVLPNLDLYTLAGHDGAYVYVAKDIQVSDGSLTISMVANIENPTLAGFAIYSNDGQLDTSVPENNFPSGEKFVGNITTRGQVRSDFARYWNQITPENEGKWGSVEGTRDQYNWGPLDRIYEFARANNIPVKAHTFVWGSQAPNWINNLSPAEQRAEIEEWMRDYCQRYPDTAIIDVVNEAVEGHAPANYARSAFGNDWIAESFKLARRHCPNAILVYNDFNFLTWDTDAILNVIRSALDQGVIDAVGLQAHSWNDPKRWSAAEIKQKLDYIHQQTGNLPMYISEYDVEDLGMGDQYQLGVFREQFPVFYEHPAVVGVTLWGYVVGTTWRDGTGLIQSNGAHRPAMDWLMEYLGRQQ